MPRTPRTVKVKIKNISYSFHPDWVEDPEEPRGFRILHTGKWVVEWMTDHANRNLPNLQQYHALQCATEDEARAIERELMDLQDSDMPWSFVPVDSICLSARVD